jgi:ATP-binding cassette subfamily A (ABC1) protein 3
MLTGDETVSDGNAWTKNLSLLTNKKRFLQNIGYCPQFDGIIGVLSGLEMLQIFGRLRGVKNSKVKAVAKDWLNRFGISFTINRINVINL